MTSLPARNHAAALFQLAEESSSAAELEGELAAVAAALFSPEAGREAAAFLGSRAIPRQAKRTLLARVLAERVDPRVANLLYLLADRGRIALLPDIVTEYHRALEASRGRDEALVESSRPLSGSELAELGQTLEQGLGRPVRLTARRDEELIAGLRVTINDRQYELSAAGALAKLAGRLARRRKAG